MQNTLVLMQDLVQQEATLLVQAQNPSVGKLQQQILENKHDEFGQHDPNGFGMTLIAMGVVLGALAVLAVIFHLIGNVASRGLGKKKAPPAPAAKKSGATPTGEEYAAIAMALHQYASEARDNEQVCITIDAEMRRNSAWGSRVFGVMNRRAR